MHLNLRPVTLFISTVLLISYLDGSNFYRLLDNDEISLAKWVFLSVFYHKEKLSFVMNILWTFKLGFDLEGRFGSWYLLSTTILMITISQGLVRLVMIPYGHLTDTYPHPTGAGPSQLSNFSTGFTGVLFSLQYQAIAKMSTDHGCRDATSSIHVQGLFVIAIAQALIMSVPHFLASVCGICGGFLYLKIPYLAGVVLRWAALGRRNMMVRQALLSEASQSSNQRRRSMDSAARDGDDDDDAGLQWRCHICLKKNGVFLLFCDRCLERRQT